MAEWRDFDASNEPDTCLWCGRKLRRKTWPVEKPKGMEWADWWNDPRSKERKAAYDKAGDYGDGFFCGLRCAYRFGVRMAQLGNRLAKGDRS